MEIKLVPFLSHEGEEIRNIVLLIARISKQQFLSTYHSDVSVRLKSLQSSRMLTVRPCAADLHWHIIVHVSALLFRPFLCFGETTRQVVETLQYTVDEKKN
jgi:hypothetical protein